MFESERAKKDADPEDALFDAGFCRINWLEASIGVRWLFDGIIPCNSFGVLMGESGIGKSILATNLSVATMTATSFAGYEYLHREAGQYKTPDGQETGVLKPSSVVFIHGEGNPSLSQRFIASYETQKERFAKLQPYGFDYEDLRKLPVRMVSLMCTTDGQKTLRSFVKNAIGRALHRKLAQTTAMSGGLIVVDTFAAVAGVANENDNAIVQDRINALKELGSMFDAAVLVVAHTKKGTDDMRGATALWNAADFVLRVAKHKSKPGLLSLVHDKARHGPKQPNKNFQLVPFSSEAVGGEEVPVIEWLDDGIFERAKVTANTKKNTAQTVVDVSETQNIQSIAAVRDEDISAFDIYMQAVQLAVMGEGLPDRAGFLWVNLEAVRRVFDSMYQRNAEANRKAFERAHKRAMGEGKVAVSTVGEGRQLVRVVE
jgi:hypothetical protein